MLTEEEKNEIIDKAVERAMLLLPEVVGNMMQEQAVLHKMNSKFYADYPEFKEHRDCVVAEVEKVEGENTLMKYDEILAKAVPGIRERIRIKQKLDMTPPTSKPDLHFPNHGEL